MATKDWMIQNKDDETLFLYVEMGVFGKPDTLRWVPYGMASVFGSNAPMVHRHGSQGNLISQTVAYRRLVRSGVIKVGSPTPGTSRKLGTWGKAGVAAWKEYLVR